MPATKPKDFLELFEWGKQELATLKKKRKEKQEEINDEEKSLTAEKKTMDNLITRALEYLGWGGGNPKSKMDIDKRSSGDTERRPDYKLILRDPNTNGENKEYVLVEAKPVGANLDKEVLKSIEGQERRESPVQQLKAYESDYTTKLACLTSGLEWRLYLVQEDGAWSDKEFLRIKLDEHSQEKDMLEAASQLMKHLSVPAADDEQSLDHARAALKARREMLEKEHETETFIKESIPEIMERIEEEYSSAYDLCNDKTRLAQVLCDGLTELYLGADESKPNVSGKSARTTVGTFPYRGNKIRPTSGGNALEQLLNIIYNEVGKTQFDAVLRKAGFAYISTDTTTTTFTEYSNVPILDSGWHVQTHGNTAEVIRKMKLVNEAFFPGTKLNVRAIPKR